MDMRDAGSCPLCDVGTVPLDAFTFAARPDLPTTITFEFCAACDFVFAGDLCAAAYRRHYASVPNDRGHVADSDEAGSDVRLQVDHLSALLGPDFAGHLLDFGCGQGRLLAAVGRSLPDATLYGHDVANFMSPSSGVRFVPTLADLDVRFDVIVVSHVLEHLVGFEILSTLANLLAPRGHLYVEVPNPLEYKVCVRREFMYYFDRLHINHFSSRSMRRLLSRFGLEVTLRGTHRFAYRDGLYPAAYYVASRPDARVDDETRADARSEDGDEPTLDVAYLAYRDGEALRAARVRHALDEARGADGILVYGAGDNFQRARRSGGPLHDMPLLSVMDERARELPAQPGIVFETPAAALSRFPSAPVVVTVSQGADEIATAIRADWPARRILFV